MLNSLFILKYHIKNISDIKLWEKFISLEKV